MFFIWSIVSFVKVLGEIKKGRPETGQPNMVCYIVRYTTSGPSSLLIIEVIESADAKSISSHILHFLPHLAGNGYKYNVFSEIIQS